MYLRKWPRRRKREWNLGGQIKGGGLRKEVIKEEVFVVLES